MLSSIQSQKGYWQLPGWAQEMVTQAHCRQAAAESFNNIAHLFQARSLGLVEGINPVLHTWAPPQRIFCVFKVVLLASRRCLTMSRRWQCKPKDDPTCFHLPRPDQPSLPPCAAACRCKPLAQSEGPAVGHLVTEQCAVEP